MFFKLKRSLSAAIPKKKRGSTCARPTPPPETAKISSGPVVGELCSGNADVVIRNEVRHGQKWTLIQGLTTETEAQLEDHVDFFNGTYECKGFLQEEEEKTGFTILLQGDHRKKVSEYLYCEGICDLTDVSYTNSEDWD
jgi:translation initiation factor 1 (eIF-1/SUI1)